jgi:hypothetical protein
MSEQITTDCAECGMRVDSTEYHPYAACLMFKQCHDSTIVQANLDAVVVHGMGKGGPHRDTAEDCPSCSCAPGAWGDQNTEGSNE